MGSAPSRPSFSSVLPSLAASHIGILRANTVKLKSFTQREIALMEKLLPSFVFVDKSTESHRHIAAVHWDKAFKEPPVPKHNTSGRVSHRETRHLNDQQSSKIMRLYDVFFACLEEHSPELKPVFRSSLHVRGKVLVHISVGMRTLIVSENFMDKILTLTKTHRRFGVKVEHYEPLGKALLHAMQVVSEHHWSPEIEDAWKRLFSHTSVILITAQLKVDDRVTKEAAKPIVTRVERMMPLPDKAVKIAASPSLADLVPQFLSRKGSARDSALTGTKGTTGTSWPRDTEH